MQAYQAIGIIQNGNFAAAYAQAESHIAPCLRQTMSLPQRMVIGYILGLSSMASKQHAQAAAHFETALELALRLHEPRAYAELSYLSAYAYWQQQAIRTAGHYYNLALHSLREYSRYDTDATASDTTFELMVLTRTALADWCLGSYERCQQHLQEAQAMVMRGPSDQRAAATIPWVQALMLHNRGELDSALQHAMIAADMYEQLGPSGSCVRIQAVVADIALDLAESFGVISHSRGRDAFITLAEPYLTSALDVARRTCDRPGEGLALLAYARLARLRQDETNPLGLLEHVVRVARDLPEATLLGQAYTALGRELAARGIVDAASSHFRMAQDVFAVTGEIALQVPAQRALLRAREMSVIERLPTGEGERDQ
jgi:tetratricopeptide (TPR) repeat protein